MVRDHVDRLIDLDTSSPVWDRIYTVAPLVLVASKEPDGSFDIAPKHMAMPLGWDNYFGFMCTARHRTFRNIEREKVFTVTYPRPSQVLLASLAASSPTDDDPQPVKPLPLISATKVEGVFVAEGSFFLECRLMKIVDGFSQNALIAGEVIAAHAHEDALRISDRDDADLLRDCPQLAFLPPDRYASIRETTSFPFPVDFRR